MEYDSRHFRVFPRGSRERQIKHVPSFIKFGLLVFLVLQMIWHNHQQEVRPAYYYQELDTPLGAKWYKALFKGAEKIWSNLLLLDIQLHDNQAGRHLSYQRLDYQKLGAWLLTMNEVNPSSDYPGFLASRIYAQVASQDKVRRMIGIIEELFERDPVRHWRRMTEATLLAKHKLKDLPLALELAEKVAALPPSMDLPQWARDMRVILLDELDQNESALVLISSMIESGTITSPDELRFLKARLLKIQQKLLESGQTSLFE